MSTIERVRADFEKARLEQYCKEVQLELTMEMAYAQVERKRTLDQIISELELATEKKA